MSAAREWPPTTEEFVAARKWYRETPLTRMQAYRYRLRFDVVSRDGIEAQAGDEVFILRKDIDGLYLRTAACPCCKRTADLGGAYHPVNVEVIPEELPTLTDAQAHSVGHALGEQWKPGRKKGTFRKTKRYRNYAIYFEGPQPEWEELVAIGLAEVNVAPEGCRPKWLYRVTPKGELALDAWNAANPVPPWCRP